MHAAIAPLVVGGSNTSIASQGPAIWVAPASIPLVLGPKLWFNPKGHFYREGRRLCEDQFATGYNR